MCTVTYIPDKEHYILTSNRDEHIARTPSLLPEIYSINHVDVIFPKDQLAGGTWFISSGHRTGCVLNGAFEKHKHLPPYRLSRGLIVLDIFKYPNNKAFIDNIDLHDIEPFTLVLIDDRSLLELRWDGEKKHVAPLDPNKKHIWSSSTLYDKSIIKQRESLFESFITSGKLSREHIFNFHKTGKVGDPTQDLVMKRNNGVQTVSITQLYFSNDSANMYQENFATNQSGSSSLKLQSVA